MKHKFEIVSRVEELRRIEKDIKKNIRFALFSRRAMHDSLMCAVARREELEWVLEGEVT